MKENFNREVSKLKKHVLAQSVEVEKAIVLAVKAIDTLDKDIADMVLQGEAAIDREEINIEEECLKILALYQPVATDLRTVVALLKINTALERMGDYAVHTAKRLPILEGNISPDSSMTLIDFHPIQKEVLTMLKDAMLAVNDFDVIMAHDIIRRDDDVDKLHSANVAQISTIITKSSDHVCYYLQAQGVSRDLERIADLCSEICEHIVYLKTGKIIRHLSK